MIPKVICARVADWETNYTSIMWPKHIDHCKDLAPGNYDMLAITDFILSADQQRQNLEELQESFSEAIHPPPVPTLSCDPQLCSPFGCVYFDAANVSYCA